LTFQGRRPWIESSIFHGLLYATPILFAWCVTTLALSLRQPRSSFRSLARSAGFVMNTAAIAGVLCISILSWSRLYLHLVSWGGLAGSFNRIEWLVFILMAVTLAPVAEETFYRGFLYNALRQSRSNSLGEERRTESTWS